SFERDALRAASIDAASAIAVREDRRIVRCRSFERDALRAASIDAASAIAVREDRRIVCCRSFERDALRAGCNNSLSVSRVCGRYRGDHWIRRIAYKCWHGNLL